MSWLWEYVVGLLSSRGPNCRFESCKFLQIQALETIEYMTKAYAESRHVIAKTSLSDGHFTIQAILTEDCWMHLVNSVYGVSHSELLGAIIRVESGDLVVVESEDAGFDETGLGRDIRLVIKKLAYLSGAGTELVNYNIYTVSPPPLNGRPNIQALLKNLPFQALPMSQSQYIVNFAWRHACAKFCDIALDSKDIMKLNFRSKEYFQLADSVPCSTGKKSVPLVGESEPACEKIFYDRESSTKELENSLVINSIRCPIGSELSLACKEHRDILHTQFYGKFDDYSCRVSRVDLSLQHRLGSGNDFKEYQVQQPDHTSADKFECDTNMHSNPPHSLTTLDPDDSDSSNWHDSAFSVKSTPTFSFLSQKDRMSQNPIGGHYQRLVTIESPSEDMCSSQQEVIMTIPAMRDDASDVEYMLGEDLLFYSSADENPS